MKRRTPAGMVPAPVVQRRADYRVVVPTEEEATCTFRVPRKFDRPAYVVRLELCDASAGGLSVADYDRRLVEEIGTTVRACELRFPGHATRPVLVDLQLLRAHEVAVHGKPARTQIVCQFVNPSYAASLAIRRYIINLERRHIARTHGVDRWHTH